jgi:hypothetical protein
MSETDKYISYSRVQAWRSCHARHYWKYIENLERLVAALPLERGKVLHELLEKHLKGESWEQHLDVYRKDFDNLFEEQKAELGNLPFDVEKLMRGYVKIHSKGIHKYPVVEYEFDVPLFEKGYLKDYQEAYRNSGYSFPDNIHFIGKIDAITTVNNVSWIVEHKTTNRIPSEDVRFFDLQTVLYMYAIQNSELGADYKPNGIMWDYIRTKAPVEPEMLSRGGLSKRKNIDTDYDTYLRTIDKYHLDPAEYADMLNMLREKPNTFYKRVYMPLAGNTLTNNLLEDFRLSALDIIINGSNDKVKNLSMLNCNNCDYKLLCQAELTGGDIEFVKSQSYRVKEKRVRTDNNINNEL